MNNSETIALALVALIAVVGAISVMDWSKGSTSSTFATGAATYVGDISVNNLKAQRVEVGDYVKVRGGSVFSEGSCLVTKVTASGQCNWIDVSATCGPDRTATGGGCRSDHCTPRYNYPTTIWDGITGPPVPKGWRCAWGSQNTNSNITAYVICC